MLHSTAVKTLTPTHRAGMMAMAFSNLSTSAKDTGKSPRHRTPPTASKITCGKCRQSTNNGAQAKKKKTNFAMDPVSTTTMTTTRRKNSLVASEPLSARQTARHQDQLDHPLQTPHASAPSARAPANIGASVTVPNHSPGFKTAVVANTISAERSAHTTQPNAHANISTPS